VTTPKRIYLATCIVLLAVALAAWAATPYLAFTINMTESLPGTLYVVHKGGRVGSGDLIAFHWPGGAGYPAGTTFIKRVVGMSGDKVTVVGRAVWINDRLIGIAKPRSRAGFLLSPVPGGVIGQGEFFVATASPDSLDSRYALCGNVKKSAVIGRAYGIF